MTYDPTKTPQELRAHIGALAYASIHRDQLLPLLDDLADTEQAWIRTKAALGHTIAERDSLRAELKKANEWLRADAESLRLAREALGPFIDPAVHLTFMGDRDRRIYLSVTRPEYQAAKIAARDLASRPATEGGAK